MALSIRSVIFLLLAFAACSTEAFWWDWGRTESRALSEADVVAEEMVDVEAIEEIEELEIEPVEDEEEAEEDSHEAESIKAYEEASHQMDLEQHSHEYEEAMIRAQQLEDQATYEQELALSRLESTKLSPTDQEQASDANDISGAVLKEAKEEKEHYAKYSDERRRQLMEERRQLMEERK